MHDNLSLFHKPYEIPVRREYFRYPLLHCTIKLLQHFGKFEERNFGCHLRKIKSKTNHLKNTATGSLFLLIIKYILLPMLLLPHIY